MFSAISHLIDLDGASVLDLYAGSGALGCEAASRGATNVVFVDSSKKAQRVLSANIARVKQALGDHASFQTVTSPALAYCQKLPSGEFFDLVVMDPPYDAPSQEVVECLQALRPALHHNSVVVVERGKKSLEPDWPAEFEVTSKKTYGDTVVYYLETLR